MAGLIGREWAREIDWTPRGRHGMPPPELTVAPPVLSALGKWIEQNTAADERILFETSLARIHDNAHGAAYLALRTGREFLGAPYPFLQASVSFWDGMALGRPVSSMSPERLGRHLESYRVSWVMAHSPQLVDLLGRTKTCRLLAERGPVKIFGVDRRGSPFVVGSGRVVLRQWNEIRFDDVSGSEVVLPYHWVRGIASDPPLELKEFYTDDGFGPFIRIAFPPTRFSLFIR